MSLIQKIISWQQETAKKEHLEPYMVLPFGTIKEIVRVQPKTHDELLRIKGIGPAKIRKYGDDILAIVRGEGIVGNEKLKIKNEYIKGGGDLFGEAEMVNQMVQSVNSHQSSVKNMEFDAETGEIIEEKKDDAVSVGEFVAMLDTMLRTNFRSVRVRGEIVGFKRNPNGHAYFEIKDKEGILRCAVFKNSYELSGLDLEDGMEIIITGYPNYHKQYGFSFIGQTVELYGEGALKKAYDELKKKLEKEGLFDQEKKRKLPKLPKKIGLITSRNGAAIGDFTTNVGKYGYKIIFHHSTVEGVGALTDLKEALTTMAKRDLDVLVIVRGGGSLESLQAFNNENIVRLIAYFPVPVVAGVGHEQDETITTLVADVGVSTPTAAAHAVRESWDKLDKFITNSEQYILHSFEKVLQEQKAILKDNEYKLKDIFDSIIQSTKELFVKFNFVVQKIDNEIDNKKRNLQNNLKELSFALDKIVYNYSRVLQNVINVMMNFQSAIERDKKQIVFLEKAICSNDPRKQLALGYSITTNSNGKIIRSVKQVKKDDKIKVQVNDGKIESRVI